MFIDKIKKIFHIKTNTIKCHICEKECSKSVIIGSFPQSKKSNLIFCSEECKDKFIDLMLPEGYWTNNFIYVKTNNED